METKRRELKKIPFNKVFEVMDGSRQICRSTGYEVMIRGIDHWLLEYIDPEGNYHYW